MQRRPVTLNVRPHDPTPMRPEIADPVPDQAALVRVLPLAEQIYRLHEAGQNYGQELNAVSALVGRVVKTTEVLYAFGVGEPEYFARKLLTDWSKFPTDLSREELLELLNALLSVSHSQDREEYWLKCIEASTGEPDLTDLIYYPDQYRGGQYDGSELTAEQILDIALIHGRRGAA